MDIINHQLFADGVLIADLPRLHYGVTVSVWSVPTDYRANGFFVATQGEWPGEEFGEPVFSAFLPADAQAIQLDANRRLIMRLTEAVQAHMDSTVQQRGYDTLLSACTYANSANPTFKAEGDACVAWRDAVWDFCYEWVAEAQAGLAMPPTEQELILALPELVW